MEKFLSPNQNGPEAIILNEQKLLAQNCQEISDIVLDRTTKNTNPVSDKALSLAMKLGNIIPPSKAPDGRVIPLGQEILQTFNSLQADLAHMESKTTVLIGALLAIQYFATRMGARVGDEFKKNIEKIKNAK